MYILSEALLTLYEFPCNEEGWALLESSHMHCMFPACVNPVGDQAQTKGFPKLRASVKFLIGGC